MGLCPDYMLPESGGNSTTGYLNITYEEVKPNKAKTATNKETEVQSLILVNMGTCWIIFPFFKHNYGMVLF